MKNPPVKYLTLQVQNNHRIIRGAVFRLLCQSSIVVALLLNVTSAWAWNPVQTCEDAGTLAVNKPVRKLLKGGAPQCFQLNLRAGQFIRLVVSQQDIDVVVSLSGPDGRLLREESSLSNVEGEAVVFWLAEADGAYRFEIRTPEKDSRPGYYVAKVSELRAGTPRDKSLVAAEDAIAAGSQALRTGSPEAPSAAYAKFDVALSLLNAAGDKKRAALAIRRKAFTLVIRNHTQDALPLYQEALGLLETEYGTEHIKVTPALLDLADVLARLNRLKEAQGVLERALNIVEKSSGVDSLPAAIVTNYLTRVLIAQNDITGALDSGQRARRIYETRYGPDSINFASATATVAYVLQRGEQYQQAQSMFEQALKSFEKRYGNRAPELISTLLSLSQVLLNLGQAEEGLAQHTRALQIIEEQYGRESLPAARAYGERGNILVRLRKLGEAREAYQHSLKISPPISPGAASATLGIATTFNAEGDFPSARAKYDEALQITAQLLGQESLGVAYGLMAKANAYPRAQDYAEGSKLYEKAIKICEKVEGADGLSVADALLTAGDYDSDHKKYPQAREKYERARTIYMKKDGVNSTRAANLLQKIGESLDDEGKFEEALEPVRNALRTYERAYGPNHRALLDPIKSLSWLLIQNKLIDEARAQIERALQIVKDNQLDEDLIAGNLLGIMTHLNYGEGRYSAAREAAERSLKIYEKYPRHRSIAEEIEIRNILGLSILMEGNPPRARVEMEKTLAITKERLWPSAPGSIMALTNMALLLSTLGDFESIARHVDYVRSISQSLVAGEDSEAIKAVLLTSLLAVGVGKKSEARELMKKGVELAESFTSPNSFAMADIYATQALLLGAVSDYAASEEASAKADKMLKEVNPEFMSRAMLLVTRGEIFFEQSKLPEARATLEEALRIFQKRLGNKHSMVAVGLNRLAWIYYLQGDVNQSRDSYIKAADVTYHYVRDVLPTLSLAEQRLFLNMQIPDQVSGLLATCREGAPLRNAYEPMFRWKGSLVDSLRRQSIITRLGQAGTHSPQVTRLQEVRAQLAGIYYKGQTMTADEWRQKNDDLTKEKEALERELARALKPGELDDPLDIGLAGFQRVLRPDEVFIDVYLYNYWTKDDNEEHYAVILTGPTGNPSLIDLGSAKKINSAVMAWRNEVLADVDATDKWETLTKLLWKPVADALPPAARRVWVSPDGELARVPWQLLPLTSPKGINLLLTQTDSARELARLRRTNRDSGPQAISIFLAGDINFNAERSPKSQHVAGEGFKRINGAAAELAALRAIGEKFRAEVIPLTGAEANKPKVIANLQKSTYAHLITHGFFSREVNLIAPSTGRATRFRTGPLNELIPPNARNPLVESGVALAGANMRAPLTLDAEGLLTAEEIIGLDLTRCELVTLSACETGRGVEVTGQGVMGLRASVMTAGSRSMLMSLWKVPDEPTVKLMAAFYHNLWMKKMTKAEALLRAQETIRDDPSGKYRNPINWAAWVLAGEAW